MDVASKKFNTMHEPTAEYYIKGEWRVCKPLSIDCKNIVNDLVNSAHVAQNWSAEKQYEYFHRAVSIACDLATFPPKSKLAIFTENIIETLGSWWYSSPKFRE